MLYHVHACAILYCICERLWWFRCLLSWNALGTTTGFGLEMGNAVVGREWRSCAVCGHTKHSGEALGTPLKFLWAHRSIESAIFNMLCIVLRLFEPSLLSCALQIYVLFINSWCILPRWLNFGYMMRGPTIAIASLDDSVHSTRGPPRQETL